MSEDRPAFPCYAKEWIASTRGLTPAARGVYWDMLCFAWINDGCPADLEELRLQLGVERADWRRLWPKLAPKWTERDGRLYNTRLEFIRQESRAYKQAKAIAGQASARARRQKYGSARPPNRTPNTRPNTPPNSRSGRAPNATSTAPEPASAYTDRDTYCGDHSVAGIAARTVGFAPPPPRQDRAVELALEHARKVEAGEL